MIGRIAILLVVLVLVSACEMDPARKKKARLKLVEKMATERTDSLRKELDSLCVLEKEHLMKHLVDSVLEARLSEIREKMKEFENE